MKNAYIFIGTFIIGLFFLSCYNPNSLNDLQAEPGPNMQVDANNALRSISDGGHSGNEHFFFLPPMVSNPVYSGIFDASLAPEVKINEYINNTYGEEIAVFNTTSEPGSETVRVNIEDEHYIVNWHTDKFNLEISKIYRITISAIGIELGFADVIPVNNGKEMKNVDTDEYIPLVDGRTLPIKFRIEDGAFPVVDHFNIEFLSSGTTVKEEEVFSINITAEDINNNKVTNYSGSPIVNSNWGDLRLASFSTGSNTLGIVPVADPVQPVFSDGKATVSIKLNIVGKAILSVQDGSITGTSSEINVIHKSWDNFQMVVNNGSEGTYDTFIAGHQTLMKDGSIYKMWYSGHAGTTLWRIIYCDSIDGITWSNYQKVIDVGNAGTFDQKCSAHPCIIKDGNLYKMWYLGQDNSNVWRIIYCDSTDGKEWDNFQMVLNPGIEGISDIDYFYYPPSVIKEGNIYKMWFSGRSSSKFGIIYCDSLDGKIWSDFQIVINPGSEETYDIIGAYASTVIKDGNVYKMWYSGDDFTYQRIIYCDSIDGKTWENYEMVIDKGSEGLYDQSSCNSPTVIKDGNVFKIWYLGHDGSNVRIIYCDLTK